MYEVYILKSLVKERYYTGHTQDLDVRLKRHNQGLVKSTKAYKPWKVIYSENAENKNDAYRREMKIKSYKKGEAFKKLINQK